MAKFIVAYTGTDDEDASKILLNLDHVARFEATEDEPGYTTACMADGKTFFYVEEALDDVAKIVGALTAGDQSR